MKGSQKKIHDPRTNRTNFNDWSDPKCKQIFHEKYSKPLGAKYKELEPDLQPEESIISETTNEIETIRRKIKAGSPLLSLDEVRDFRLPFHQSLLKRLQGSEFTCTYQFIKDVIDIDDSWHVKTEHNHSVRKRPQLKLDESVLRFLIDGVTKAEQARKEGDKVYELFCLLDLASEFTNRDYDSWNWLSEELYELCVYITDSVQSPTEDDKELAAVIKYLFAEFLLDILQEPRYAKHLVEESMKLSEGTSYNAVVLTGKTGQILYLDCCMLLHKIYLLMGDDCRESNVENSIFMYKQSLHWAKSVNDKTAETTALLHLTDLYVTAKQLENIPNALENYLKLCTEENNASGICEGYILSAKYHNLKQEYDLESEDLQALLTISQKNNIFEMVALAHHKLALFYILQKKNLAEAQSHATEAYHCYMSLKRLPEVQTSGCLIGICQGQRILSDYINILSKATGCNNDFDTLMKWKLLRIPFSSNIKLLQIESDENAYMQKKMKNLRKAEMAEEEAQDDRLFSVRTHRMSEFSLFSNVSQMTLS